MTVYVQVDDQGKVFGGVFANPQPGSAETEMAADDPRVIAFLRESGAPTLDEVVRPQQDAQLRADVDALKAQVAVLIEAVGAGPS